VHCAGKQVHCAGKQVHCAGKQVHCAGKHVHCAGKLQPSSVLTTETSKHGQPGKTQALTQSVTHSLVHKCLFYGVTLLPLRLFNDAVTCIQITDRTTKYLNGAVQCMWPNVRRCRGTEGGGCSRCGRNCGQFQNWDC
jgi:hypothetical protein